MDEELLEQVDEIEQDGATDPNAGHEPESKPDKKDEGSAELKKLQRENAQLRKRAGDAEQAAQFWSEKAQGAAPKGAVPAAEEEEPRVSVDLVEAITNGDTKALKTALREMGFVESKDVDSKIGATRAQIAEESKLYGKYPELQDDGSDMFAKTKEIYLNLAKDPAMAKSSKLVEVAAEMAALQLGQGGNDEPRRGRQAQAEEDDLDEQDDEEQERVERVRAQQGSRGRASMRSRESEDLSPMQRSIVARFKAAGANISEDAYRKRASQGIRLSGLPTRARGRK